MVHHHLHRSVPHCSLRHNHTLQYTDCPPAGSATLSCLSWLCFLLFCSDKFSGLKMESFPSKIRLGDTRGSVYRYNQPEIEAEAWVWFFVMPTQPPQINTHLHLCCNVIKIWLTISTIHGLMWTKSTFSLFTSAFVTECFPERSIVCPVCPCVCVF